MAEFVRYDIILVVLLAQLCIISLSSYNIFLKRLPDWADYSWCIKTAFKFGPLRDLKELSDPVHDTRLFKIAYMDYA